MHSPINSVPRDDTHMFCLMKTESGEYQMNNRVTPVKGSTRGLVCEGQAIISDYFSRVPF
jgi:hypothetical protein